MTVLHQSIKKQNENVYKTRIVSWLRPTPDRIKSLLSDGGTSLRSAILWLVTASIFYTVLNQIDSLYQNYREPISAENIIKIVGKIFTGSAVQLIGYFLFCGTVHFVSKLFKKDGSLKEYLSVYSFFNSPSIVIFGLISSIWFIFHSYVGLVSALLFSLYYLFWLNSIAIAFVYKFHWVNAFFLNFFITAILVSVLFVLYLNGLL